MSANLVTSSAAALHFFSIVTFAVQVGSFNFAIGEVDKVLVTIAACEATWVPASAIIYLGCENCQITHWNCVSTCWACLQIHIKFVSHLSTNIHLILYKVDKCFLTLPGMTTVDTKPTSSATSLRASMNSS